MIELLNFLNTVFQVTLLFLWSTDLKRYKMYPNTEPWMKPMEEDIPDLSSFLIPT